MRLLAAARAGGGVSAEQWALIVGLPFGQVSNLALFVVLAQMREGLALSYSELGLVLASFGIARVLMDLPAGALVQRFNPRTALLASLGGTLVAAILGLAATSAWQVAAARFLHGASTSVVQCAILAWLVGSAHSSMRGRVMALSEMVFSVVGLVVPVTVGVLAGAMSWRAAFALGIVAALLAAACTAAWTRADSAKVALGLPMEAAEPRRLLSRWGDLRLGGATLLCAYVMTFIIFFGRQALISTLLPLLGAEHVGMSSLHVGVGLMLVNMVSIAAVMLGGWAGDRYGRRPLMVPGILVLLLCQLSALLISSEPAFLMVAAVTGLGFFMNSMPLSLIGDALPPQVRADGVAVFRLVADVGVLLAPTVIGFSLDAGGFTTAELVAPGATLAGLLAVIGIIASTQSVREKTHGRVGTLSEQNAEPGARQE
ncbi:MAG TPA: MFS transporter [Chloroflexota bacterium]|nr:MFS transporter [Chloroflexota bacterium]